ncbi:hypothetical protein DSO57_1023363 [Entomophthora muscae]|uniref:Uncharacterized protein n=1 Tax=Entomophthora muscae TaxID=34485 RepID=A0ACC2S4Y0_9FUNG|nr:hypothetical protein DSO57_1023363 [Entomophthora muscae]
MVLEEGLFWSGSPLDFRRHHQSIAQTSYRQTIKGFQSMGFWWNGSQPITSDYDCFENEACQLHLHYRRERWGASLQKKRKSNKPRLIQIKATETNRFVIDFGESLSCTVLFNPVSWKFLASRTRVPLNRPKLYPIRVSGIPSGLISLKCLTLPNDIPPL